MKKYFPIILLVLFSLLNGLGQKPGVPADLKEVAPGKFILKDPEKQFEAGYKQYLEAKRTHYYKFVNKAIGTFEDYQTHYPKHNKINDSHYFIHNLYKMSDQSTKAREHLEVYLESADKDDFYYRFAMVDKAKFLINEGKDSEALKLLSDLMDNYKEAQSPEDSFFKRDIYVALLPLYQKNKEQEKLIETYEYLLSNERYIETINLRNSYKFKLAELYMKSENNDAAKKLFNEIYNKLNRDINYRICSFYYTTTIVSCFYK